MESTVFQEELKWINPNRLIKDGVEDPVADFFLVLGLIYNDLKSLIFQFAQVEKKLQAMTARITTERGEYGGMKWHLERLMVGTMRELFEFLKSSGDVLETTEFAEIYKRLNSEEKSRWDVIASIAKGGVQRDGAESDFTKIMVMIRGNLAFHYHQSPKVLKKGFIDFFRQSPKQPWNEKAYFTTGGTMRDTRFYFADAAVQGAIGNQVSRMMSYDEYGRKLNVAIDNANFAIMALMKEFLRTRPA
jgi:hypothetical protein